MSRTMDHWRAEERNDTPDTTKLNATLVEVNESPALEFPFDTASGEPVYAHFKGFSLGDYMPTNGPPEVKIVWFTNDTGAVGSDVQWEAAIHRIPGDCTDNVNTDFTFTFDAGLGYVGNCGTEGNRRYTTVVLNDSGSDDGLQRCNFLELEVRRTFEGSPDEYEGSAYIQHVVLLEPDR